MEERESPAQVTTGFPLQKFEAVKCVNHTVCFWGCGRDDLAKRQKTHSSNITAKAPSLINVHSLPEAGSITNSKVSPGPVSPRDWLFQGGEQGTAPLTMAKYDLLVEGRSELNFTIGSYLHLKAMQSAAHLSTRNVFSLLFYLYDEWRAYVR